MKKRNFKKGLFALALASGLVVGGSLEDVYAQTNEVNQETLSASEAYKAKLDELKNLYEKSLAIKNDYLYINASSTIKNNFDLNLDAARKLIEREEESNLNQDFDYGKVKAEIEAKISYLKDSFDKLDGDLVNTDELIELLEDSKSFMRDDKDYQIAPFDLKAAYDKAIEKGYEIYGQGISVNEKSYKNVLKEIKDSKEKIIQYAKRLEARESLGKQIEAGLKLIDEDNDKYTKESIKVLKLSLDEAKAILDNEKASLENITNSIEKLAKAKAELVTKESYDKLQEAIKKLEEAKERNLTTVKAARMLLDNYPNTVKNIKADLEELIAKSDKLIKEADELLEKYQAE
ncbi:MAG: hypothetical protein Q4D88_05415 [Anaerococcus sp.]|nr:hypothetical protein [Anaerococcus sp.]